MKILFQGGYKEERDSSETKARVEDYCRELARRVVDGRHELILTSPRACDQLIAEEVERLAKTKNRDLKGLLLFLLPERFKEIPTIGRVRKFQGARWWMEERTYMVNEADALIAVGGGKGTADCATKAFLTNKPVFVACAVGDNGAAMWANRPANYHYLEAGDAEFVSDLNTTPAEFFDGVFDVLDRWEAQRDISYPRKIFIVHGRDHRPMKDLCSILSKLEFEPIVLKDQPSMGDTIIEKIERYVEDIGFAFILYTPDDVGSLAGAATSAPRARQNVVFEHGLLMGKMRRRRTCGLLLGAIEEPSDLKGLEFINVKDIEADRFELCDILEKAGYEVDRNLLSKAK